MAYPEQQGPPVNEVFVSLSREEYERVRYLQRELGIRDVPSLFTFLVWKEFKIIKAEETYNQKQATQRYWNSIGMDPSMMRTPYIGPGGNNQAKDVINTQ